jgi:low affinity Fe/Cu permease
VLIGFDRLLGFSITYLFLCRLQIFTFFNVLLEVWGNCGSLVNFSGRLGGLDGGGFWVGWFGLFGG